MATSNNKPTLRERFQYRFDNFMAAGARSIFAALIVLFLGALVFTGAVRLAVVRAVPQPIAKGASAPTVQDDLWTSFIQILDPGAVVEDNNSLWYIKAVAVVTVLLGLIFFSAVIAFITTQLDLKIEELKKGRSRVIEDDHTLILGWGDRVLEIIRELIIANESESSASIVVMSDKPKEFMDDYFQERLPDRKSTRIITRTGVPSSLEELERVAVTSSRSVVILPDANEASTWDEKVIADSKTIKTLLAVVAASRDDATKASIATEVFDRKNRDLMISLAPENITIIETEDMLAKIIVQTSRSTGLAAVYGSLIGFEGCEFYFHTAAWNGITFGDAAFRFVDGILLGIRDTQGRIFLRPEPGHVLQDGDALIMIAEDDSTIAFKPKPVCEPREFATPNIRLQKKIERELIIGWNSKARTIIEQYTDYILPGSVIDVVLPGVYTEGVAEVESLQKANPGHKISVISANALNGAELEALGPQNYNNVVILNKTEDDLEKVDSHTVMILLLLRRLFSKTEKETGKRVRTQIISEVMDSDNLELVNRTGADDFIISNQMISKIFAQVAENPAVLEVYEHLFQEDGSEIYLKPVKLYFKELPKDTLTFADLMMAARGRGEICLGYRRLSEGRSIEDDFGVKINPSKTAPVSVSMEDHLIVLAEDEL